MIFSWRERQWSYNVTNPIYIIFVAALSQGPTWDHPSTLHTWNAASATPRIDIKSVPRRGQNCQPRINNLLPSFPNTSISIYMVSAMRFPCWGHPSRRGVREDGHQTCLDIVIFTLHYERTFRRYHGMSFLRYGWSLIAPSLRYV